MRSPLRANDVRSDEATRHGAYLLLGVAAEDRETMRDAPVGVFADRLGLRSEFETKDGHPPEAIAYVRRVSVRPADIADPDIANAEAIVHVASKSAESVERFCSGLQLLLGSAVTSRVIGGVVRPMRYTGNAMYNFAYAHQVLQQPGSVMPNAFLVPMSKTASWWAKDWMERHSYFLPRYAEGGHVLSDGHARAAAAGIPVIMRRTYRNPVEPAPPGSYDFINYFECRDEDVSTFHEVCDSLRDVKRNPEWQFVREGPSWQGRRVATWADLFS